jgi:aminoglycoside phosphotransferase (APT) family kinase protein
MTLEEESLIFWINNNIDGLGDFKNFNLINNGVSRKTSIIEFTDRSIVTRQSIINHHAASQTLHREFNVQKLLQPYFPVPDPIIFCNDKSIVGHPFYVMNYSDGYSTKDIVEKNNSSETIKKYVENSFQQLINLHSLNKEDIGIKSTFTPESYIKNQILRWSREYKSVSQSLQLNLEKLLIWFFKNIPEVNSSCILHNDWRMDNIIFSKSDNKSVL